jgi:hypothetical protein
LALTHFVDRVLELAVNAKIRRRYQDLMGGPCLNSDRELLILLNDHGDALVFDLEAGFVRVRDR